MPSKVLSILAISALSMTMAGCVAAGMATARHLARASHHGSASPSRTSSSSGSAAVVAVQPGETSQTGDYTAKTAPGPYNVKVETGEWRDAGRGGRAVPWKLYLPSGLGQAAPLVIWSHGGGGSRDGAAYLGQHLASYGIAALHIQHAGSDTAAFRADPRAIVAGVNDPKLALDRYLDVQFVLKQVHAQAAGPWKGVVDDTRIGMSGHSYGAITTQIAAGQTVKGFGQSLADPEFKGGFIMSPSPPRAGYDAGAATFNNMLFPLFHLTGTEDSSPADDFGAADRRYPFDHISGVDQYLVIFKGGTHMTFTGENRTVGRAKADPALEQHLPLIKAAAVAFWQAYLNGDAKAKTWLTGGGYARLVDGQGSVEVKLAGSR